MLLLDDHTGHLDCPNFSVTSFTAQDLSPRQRRYCPLSRPEVNIKLFRTIKSHSLPYSKSYFHVRTFQIHLSCKPQKKTRSLFISFVAEICKVTGIVESEKGEVPSLAECIPVQSIEMYCHAALVSVGGRGAGSNVNRDKVLVPIFRLIGPPQRDVRISIRYRFLHLCHHSLLAGFPSERHMYDYMSKELYWTQMETDIYAAVRVGGPCA